MNVLFAQPYSMSASGFYFRSEGDFEKKAAENIDPGTGELVEEYSFEFIDGDSLDALLFQEWSKNSSDLEFWFDELELMEEEEKVALLYLITDLGYKFDPSLLDKVQNVELVEGQTAEDYVEDLLRDDNLSWEVLKRYFDAEALARDMKMNGDVAEWTLDGKTYLVTNASDI
jgi:hypothetical protein